MPLDIEANVAKYLGARQPTDRYTSFDYCFNYFQSYRETHQTAAIAARGNLELSCLQLGFYLASWGMMRGSADLLQHSARHLGQLIHFLADAPAPAWDVDSDSDPVEAWEILSEVSHGIRIALPGSTDTLVTKIMLGVFGSVPAFDMQFTRGFGVRRFNNKSLQLIHGFYRDNAEVIERNRGATLAFDTGKETTRRYTRAKVIDMIFFIEGARGSLPAAPTR